MLPHNRYSFMPRAGFGPQWGGVPYKAPQAWKGVPYRFETNNYITIRDRSSRCNDKFMETMLLCSAISSIGTGVADCIYASKGMDNPRYSYNSYSYDYDFGPRSWRDDYDFGPRSWRDDRDFGPRRRSYYYEPHSWKKDEYQLPPGYMIVKDPNYNPSDKTQTPSSDPKVQVTAESLKLDKLEKQVEELTNQNKKLLELLTKTNVTSKDFDDLMKDEASSKDEQASKKVADGSGSAKPTGVNNNKKSIKATSKAGQRGAAGATGATGKAGQRGAAGATRLAPVGAAAGGKVPTIPKEKQEKAANEILKLINNGGTEENKKAANELKAEYDKGDISLNEYLEGLKKNVPAGRKNEVEKIINNAQKADGAQGNSTAQLSDTQAAQNAAEQNKNQGTKAVEANAAEGKGAGSGAKFNDDILTKNATLSTATGLLDSIDDSKKATAKGLMEQYNNGEISKDSLLNKLNDLADADKKADVQKAVEKANTKAAANDLLNSITDANKKAQANDSIKKYDEDSPAVTKDKLLNKLKDLADADKKAKAQKAVEKANTKAAANKIRGLASDANKENVDDLIDQYTQDEIGKNRLLNRAKDLAESKNKGKANEIVDKANTKAAANKIRDLVNDKDKHMANQLIDNYEKGDITKERLLKGLSDIAERDGFDNAKKAKEIIDKANTKATANELRDLANDANKVTADHLIDKFENDEIKKNDLLKQVKALADNKDKADEVIAKANTLEAANAVLDFIPEKTFSNNRENALKAMQDYKNGKINENDLMNKLYGYVDPNDKNKVLQVVDAIKSNQAKQAQEAEQAAANASAQGGGTPVQGSTPAQGASAVAPAGTPAEGKAQGGTQGQVASAVAPAGTPAEGKATGAAAPARTPAEGQVAGAAAPADSATAKDNNASESITNKAKTDIATATNGKTPEQIKQENLAKADKLIDLMKSQLSKEVAKNLKQDYQSDNDAKKLFDRLSDMVPEDKKVKANRIIKGIDPTDNEHFARVHDMLNLFPPKERWVPYGLTDRYKAENKVQDYLDGTISNPKDLLNQIKNLLPPKKQAEADEIIKKANEAQKARDAEFEAKQNNYPTLDRKDYDEKALKRLAKDYMDLPDDKFEETLKNKLSQNNANIEKMLKYKHELEAEKAENVKNTMQNKAVSSVKSTSNEKDLTEEEAQLLAQWDAEDVSETEEEKKAREKVIIANFENHIRDIAQPNKNLDDSSQRLLTAAKFNNEKANVLLQILSNSSANKEDIEAIRRRLDDFNSTVDELNGLTPEKSKNYNSALIMNMIDEKNYSDILKTIKDKMPQEDKQTADDTERFLDEAFRNVDNSGVFYIDNRGCCCCVKQTDKGVCKTDKPVEKSVAPKSKKTEEPAAKQKQPMKKKETPGVTKTKKKTGTTPGQDNGKVPTTGSAENKKPVVKRKKTVINKTVVPPANLTPTPKNPKVTAVNNNPPTTPTVPAEKPKAETPKTPVKPEPNVINGMYATEPGNYVEPEQPVEKDPLIPDNALPIENVGASEKERLKGVKNPIKKIETTLYYYAEPDEPLKVKDFEDFKIQIKKAMDGLYREYNLIQPKASMIVIKRYDEKDQREVYENTKAARKKIIGKDTASINKDSYVIKNIATFRKFKEYVDKLPPKERKPYEPFLNDLMDKVNDNNEYMINPIYNTVTLDKYNDPPSDPQNRQNYTDLVSATRAHNKGLDPSEVNYQLNIDPFTPIDFEKYVKLKYIK